MSAIRRMLMVANEKTLPIIDGHEYVDLGLPSGTLWATMNVGAIAPYEKGLFFRWGETIGYNQGDSAQSYKDLTKYNQVDGPSELELVDDGVNAYWGGGWCMPTAEQLLELGNAKYITISNVTNYMGSGVGGNLFTSKINGKTLFNRKTGLYAAISGNPMQTDRAYIRTKTRSDLSVSNGYKKALLQFCTSKTTSFTSLMDEIRGYFTPLRGVYNINI